MSDILSLLGIMIIYILSEYLYDFLTYGGNK